MSDLSQVNLVAVIGAGGTIGPSDALPHMMYEEEATAFENWFIELTRGGLIVIGHRSWVWLHQRGFSGVLSEEHMFAPWSRDSVTDPDQFMECCKAVGKPIFICGGLATYTAFMPYVQQFFIRRVALDGPHDNYMPPLFGRTQ